MFVTTYTQYLAANVRNLRSKGLSFREISQTLGIGPPKGTISGWRKGIKLPESYIRKVQLELEALADLIYNELEFGPVV